MAGVEYTKLVDDVYKNILEKFNPSARQLIAAGKAYLKALHASAAASNTFNESLLKMSLNAQQCGNGTSASDIGVSIANVASVYKEIHDHHTNILKAFYVDFLVPLETNLEKDTKVVQHEQKKFLQQHKVRIESYHKAASTLKKQRKKKTNAEVSEKEMKHIQSLNEQKSKLESFCEQSLRNAITQERRRYGFVLERHCSISKHWLAYHAHGNKMLESNLDNWLDVAASREDITHNFDSNITKKMMKMEDDESRASTMKKARSVDAPYDMRSLNDHNYNQNSLPRAKSDFNLTGSSNENRDQRPIVKALYSYMPSGENQLPFAEGDRIALAGNRVKGWQFGENLRTQMFGWFPVSYTNASSAENIISEKRYSHRRESSYENVQFRNSSTGEEREFQRYSLNNDNHSMDNDHQSMASDSTYKRHDESSASPTRMFGDTLQYKNPRKYRNANGMHNNPKPGPPPPLPAPVPSTLHGRLNVSQSFCLPNGPPVVERRKKNPSNQQGKQMDQRGGAAKTSLHSSNDSGFANEPPPQPEIDYSDEETRVPIRNRREKHFKSARPASSVASWTLNRQSHGNRAQRAPLNAMRQSTSFENVIESDDEFMRGNIKRTKSFWKFGKSSEILTGMSLWQHKDLVEPTENKSQEKKHNQSSVKSKTLPRKMTNGMASTPTDDEENIYGMSTQNTPKSLKKPTMMQTIEIDIEDPSDAETIHSERNNKSHKQKLNNDTMSKMMVGQEIDVTTDDDEDTGTLKMSDVKNFFEENNKQTDNGPTKYLKRQEILKQYYSSDESVSSDPYDCIVIQDHAQKEEKIKVRKHQMSNQQPPMEFQTFRQSSGNTKSSQSSTMKMNNKKDENGPGTMLPRTKLLKSTNNNLTIEKNLKKRNKEDKIPEKDRKTYGPWYDFWEHQDVVQTNN